MEVVFSGAPEKTTICFNGVNMKIYNMEEQAVKNAYGRGRIAGWNEAVDLEKK